MLLGHFTLLALYSRNYPFADELYQASASITPAWLWAQHAEHRMPIAKLLWLGVLKLTNYDFRVGSWLSVVAVGANSFALIKVATKLRGRITFTDAFFPLAVLSFGQTLNFLWWWQIHHILAPLIATSLLMLIAVNGNELTFRRALIVGFLILLLALSGPGGLPYVLALGLWLSYRSILFLKCASKPDSRRKGLLLLTLVGIAFVLVGLYFRDYAIPPGTAAGQEGVSPPDVRAWFKGILLLLSISLGPGIKPYWQIAGPALVALLLLCVGALVVAWYRRPQERLRTLGLFLFSCAAGSLFVASARARVGLGEEYLLIGHYLTLAVPALCAAYLGSLLYARASIRRLVHVSLFLGAAALSFQNTKIGWARGVALHRGQEAFERDLRAGVPAFILSERHITFLSPATADPGEVTALLERMRVAGIPQFARMTPDPLYHAVSVPVTPLMSRETLNEETRRQPNSPGVVRLDFDLGEPRFVLGIRFRCVYGADKRRRASFQLIRRESSVHGISSRTETVAVDVNPNDMWARRHGRVGKKTVTIWINDEVARFSVVPDREPIEFRISEIDLLVPPAVPAASKP